MKSLSKKKSNYEYELIKEIRDVNNELEEAYRIFQNQTDEDLLEASIFRINELRARHSYLIKYARKNNIEARYMKFDEKEGITQNA